jgi:hypothetical protein
MGWVVTLSLHGVAFYIRGFETAEHPYVRRMRSPRAGSLHTADVALIRCQDDAQLAIATGFSGAVIVGDIGEGSVPGPNQIPQLMILPDRFGYLSDGDIIGIEPKIGRLRALYRRDSGHNAFLVTERCNHYCLMCSQPPRAIDDGWILEEISACLPLIDTDIRSLGFTGGEPLLDWRGFVALLRECRDTLPRTAIHVLSNGRAFANSAAVDA